MFSSNELNGAFPIHFVSSTIRLSASSRAGPFVPFRTGPIAAITSFNGKARAPKAMIPSFKTSKHVGGTFGYNFNV